MNRSFSLAAFFLICFCFSWSQPTQPILRIEAGMHTGLIGRLGIDNAERFIVTGSDDKTARVWDFSTGRLSQILRVPVGDGNEGKIYSVAISPDGNTIAAGGWTGYEWDNSCSIYIFDRSTGEIAKRLADQPGSVLHLTFSPDGQFLAATFSGSSGVRIYRTSDYALFYEDKEYGDRSSGAAFDNRNRLATVSFDGYVRTYEYNELQFTPVAKLKTMGGGQAFSVAFSPDGNQLAVGFNDSATVDVYSVAAGGQLEYNFSPSSEGANIGASFVAVAWSSDGRFLYAGGKYAALFDNEWKRVIRKWSEGGRGTYGDIHAAESTILDILPLKNGGVIYSAADPRFGVIDANDRMILEKKPVIGDFRFDRSTFKISDDATKIFFCYDYPGKSSALYSIIDRELSIRSVDSSSLTPPKITSSTFQLNWDNKDEPKFNGTKLELEHFEKSQSLAIAPSENGFLLGTHWYLRYYSSEGKEQWNCAVPGDAWQVNISPNGNVAVAAFGDGTIRWYRISDGKELLAFFPHNDLKRWVVWTPSGYYDASPGGEDLIGWHINNGKEKAADFYPVSRFRATYYRPDVVGKILETLDEQEALRLANEESSPRQQTVALNTILPPVIQIVSPISGSEVSTANVKIEYSLRSESGEPVTGVRALVNGRPVATKRGLQIVKRESNDELELTIPQSDCEVSLIAENKNGSSEPSTIILKWKGNTREEFVVKPKLYVLAVGIANYDDQNLTLGLSGKDAKDISNAFLKQRGLLYRDVVLKTLIDEKATKGEILDGLDWLQKETTSKDVAVIYFSGHGANDPNGIFYYLPVDVDVARLKRTAIPYSEFTNTVASIAGKVLVFADACHSGNIMGMRKGTVDITSVVNELASAENGAVVFSSSLGRQYSLEKAEWGNGAFTKALIEGISGKAAYNNGNRVTVKMLDLYVAERVKELTRGAQAPVTVFPPNVPDFPIAIIR